MELAREAAFSSFRRRFFRKYLPGLLVLASCWVPAVHARPVKAVPSQRIVLAVDGTQQLRNLPVLLAERLGLFARHGLIVTLVDAPADPSIGALVSDGRADGSVAYYHHTFESQIEGSKPAQAVLVMGATPQLTLFVASRLRDKVHSVADLAGMRIITGGINSGKTTSVVWLFQHAGLSPDGFTRLSVMPADAAMAALRQGTADAVIAHQPDAGAFAKSDSVFELADINSVAGTKKALGEVYPSTALYFPRSYILAHPREIQRLVDACREAMRYIKLHNGAEIAAHLPQQMVGKDPASFAAQVDDEKLSFDTDGRMDPKAARDMYQAMLALQPKYAPVRLNETYTNRFVGKVPSK